MLLVFLLDANRYWVVVAPLLLGVGDLVAFAALHARREASEREAGDIAVIPDLMAALEASIEQSKSRSSAAEEPDEITTRRLVEELENLPPQQRGVVHSLLVEGHSIEEVAAKRNLSVSQVDLLLHRAIKKLREGVEAEHPRDGT